MIRVFLYEVVLSAILLLSALMRGFRFWLMDYYRGLEKISFAKFCEKLNESQRWLHQLEFSLMKWNFLTSSTRSKESEDFREFKFRIAKQV